MDRPPPRIQYALSDDGVNIAFTVTGEGLPLVMAPPIPFSHVQLEWEGTLYADWLTQLSRSLRLIRYDNRGSGLSDRDVSDIGMAAQLRDIDSVVRKLGIEKFALAGICQSGPVVMAYAAANPDRVTHLLLWCSGPSPSFNNNSVQLAALDGLRSADWVLYTETIAHAMVAGWASGDVAREWARFSRAAVDGAMFNRYVDDAHFPYVESTPLLPHIAAPTLVLHRRDAPIWSLEGARKMAALIPNAELVVLEGGSLLPYVGNMDDVVRAQLGFLGFEAQAQDNRGHAGSGLRLILFTDLEGHTGMMSRLGDQRGRDLLREHERLTRDALRAHGGSEVKTLGDGFMATFMSAQNAIECATALQNTVSEHPALANQHLRVRVGINAGEPIAEDDDLFGASVIAAARIAAKALGGEILVSDVVRQLVAGKGYLFADRGPLELKGLDEPVRCWELKWDSMR